ncbi:alpha/beta hydrolase [Pseudonocardia ailaonensis]|uniref:Alpha/beta hydrolase n=1 Tax=Pseudonocardia ailaonensis TaxID=367279 RepID=A0ABN2N0I9_9PSEU
MGETESPGFAVETVRFFSEGLGLEADLFVPGGITDARPAVLVLGGFGSVRDRLGARYAREFARAGYPTLTFDYRGFGGSEGPRGRLVQNEQLQDIGNALTWLEHEPRVDADRLAVWGVSNGGAHALSIAARDERVKVMVGQNGYADGRKLVLDRPTGPDPDRFFARLAEDRRRRVFEGAGALVPATEILDSPDTQRYVARMNEEHPGFAALVPWGTAEDTLSYRPLDVVHLIERTPSLLVAAEHDDLTLAAEYRKAFDLIPAPKRWECLPCHHYDMYTGRWFKVSARLALDWFREHLSLDRP